MRQSAGPRQSGEYLRLWYDSRMNNFWKIFLAILGEAEQIVPIFIHNPKSQQIEGVIVTTSNAAIAGLAAPPPQTTTVT